MVSTWNIEGPNGEADADDGAGSLAPGPVLARRRFVEIAVASLAGATLVGLSPSRAAATPQLAGDEFGADAPCNGTARPGPVTQVIEYDELRHLHLAHLASHPD